MKILRLFLLFLFCVSCSSGKISFQSNPGKASIKMKEENGDIVDLGVTPLTVDQSEIFRRSQFVEIYAQIDEYEPHRVVVTKPFSQTNISLSFDLQKRELDKKSIDNKNSLEKVSLNIAKSYKLISQKNYAEAESILLNLKEEYPSVSVTYDFLGNIAYLRGNYADAKKYYSRAQDLNPNNVERDLLIRKLENQFGTQGEAQ